MLNNVLETTTMTTNGNTQPDRIDQMMALLSGFIEETREFMAEQKQFNAKVTEDISRLTDQVGQLITQVNGLTIRVDDLTRDVSRLTDDVGQLKGFHVRAVALQRTGSVARAFGLSEFHVLSNEETSSLANRLADYGVKENERISFAAADLIIEAHGAGRSKHYIAAEISYTANLDDVRRVIRNAGHLRLLTGSDSHAAIMGCEKTPDVDEVLANGSIIWHLISNRAMAPA
jgi:polyhydroxyalkanoate synthesis regulator phasin